MVKKEDMENIKKLSPEERIRHLRELEKQNQEEIKKAQDMIKESEDEIAIEEKVKQVEIPGSESVDVARLFKNKKEEDLEETVKKEKIKVSKEELRHQQEYLSQLPTQRIEQRAEYLQQRFEQTGYVTNEQRSELGQMYQEIRQREKGLSQGTYKSSSSHIDEEISVAKSITKTILGDLYKG
mgnify:CR=1 FL=1